MKAVYTDIRETLAAMQRDASKRVEQNGRAVARILRGKA